MDLHDRVVRRDSGETFEERSPVGNETDSGRSDISSSSPRIVPENRTLLKVEDIAKVSKIVDNYKVSRDNAPKRGDQDTKIALKFKEKYLLVPRHFFSNEENAAAIAIFKLAHLLKLDVELYDSTKYSMKKETSEDTRRVLQGLWIGCDDNINIKITRSKNETELGRAIAFAIRVRSYFRSTEWLGIAALRKDHKFFANSADYDKSTKIQREIPLIYVYMRQWFENMKEADEVAHLLSSLLEHASLDNVLDVKQMDAIISSNVIAYNDILNPLRRRPLGEASPKRSSHIRKEKGKLPEKPNNSPLMMKQEMATYHRLTNFIWSGLNPYEKDYMSSLKNETFERVVQKTRFIINLRWALLGAFSKVTTKRLRLARSEADDDRLTKRKVTESDLILLVDQGRISKLEQQKDLSDITFPVYSLSNEEKELIRIPSDVQALLDSVRNMKDDLLFEKSKGKAILNKPDESVEHLNKFESLKNVPERRTVAASTGYMIKDLDIVDKLPPIAGLSSEIAFSRKEARRYMHFIKDKASPAQQIALDALINIISGKNSKRWGSASDIGKYIVQLRNEFPVNVVSNNSFSESMFTFKADYLDFPEMVVFDHRLEEF